MSTLLYRLGRAAVARRRGVVAAWLVLLLLLGGAVAAFGGSTSSNLTIPGTQSQEALDALRTEFPQASGTSGTVVVAADEDGALTTPEAGAVLAEVAAEASDTPGVLAALDPSVTGAISPDGRVALVQVQFEGQLDEVTPEQLEAFEATGDAARDAGFTVAHGGEVTGGEPEVGSTEAIGVVVAAVVLVVTFGSLLAAGMTLLTALIGIGVGMTGIFALSGVIELTSTAPILALMLGLAVGIDYALFITSRYRQHLLAGVDVAEAAGRAVGTAGSAVVFAGATVVIALSGLAVVGIPFLTIMGLAAAATVAVAVLVALTLLPALLGFLGRRILPTRLRENSTASADADATSSLAADARPAAGAAWGRWVTHHRIPVIAAAVVALGVLAIPSTDMRLALPDGGSQPEDSGTRIAYDLTAQGFGPGANGQLAVVLSADDPAVIGATLQQLSTALPGSPGVAGIAAPQTSPDGLTALLPVIPTTGPTDPATETLVDRLRTDVTDDLPPGASLAVTGATAVGIDISEVLAGALPVYLLLVVGLSFLLLLLVFRSVLVPVTAAVGFLLTVAATFGVTVAVFQWGWLNQLVGLDTSGPLISFLPVLLVGILFGLAMDYQVFLVSRMREEFVHGASAQDATVAGVGFGARVVTAAAIIMISVFSGFVLVDDTIIKSIGFALAIGVLIDAFVVRMTVIPAVMSLLGRSAWWLPRGVDRVLPDLDVEGDKLRRLLDRSASAGSSAP